MKMICEQNWKSRRGLVRPIQSRTRRWISIPRCQSYIRSTRHFVSSAGLHTKYPILTQRATRPAAGHGQWPITCISTSCRRAHVCEVDVFANLAILFSRLVCQSRHARSRPAEWSGQPPDSTNVIIISSISGNVFHIKDNTRQQPTANGQRVCLRHFSASDLWSHDLEHVIILWPVYRRCLRKFGLKSFQWFSSYSVYNIFIGHRQLTSILDPVTFSMSWLSRGPESE